MSLRSCWAGHTRRRTLSTVTAGTVNPTAMATQVLRTCRPVTCQITVENNGPCPIRPCRRPYLLGLLAARVLGRPGRCPIRMRSETRERPQVVAEQGRGRCEGGLDRTGAASWSARVRRGLDRLSFFGVRLHFYVPRGGPAAYQSASLKSPMTGRPGEGPARRSAYCATETSCWMRKNRCRFRTRRSGPILTL
jgi:hypothetical protein